MSLCMPCRCLVCGEAFDIGAGRPNELHGRVCPECNGWLCPRCGSHDLAGPIPYFGEVPIEDAVAVRASVWGRGH